MIIYLLKINRKPKSHKVEITWIFKSQLKTGSSFMRKISKRRWDFLQNIFRAVEESHCADPTQTHKSDVFTTDTLVKSLTRAEGLLWQKDPLDTYHKMGPNKTYQRSPPSLEFLPPNYNQSPRKFDNRSFNRPTGDYEAYRRFDQPQQLSPRERMDMQLGQKRYRS